MRLFGTGAGGGEHEYDVRSFGAKGDAFTDDTAAFQAAFDACIEGGGGDVLVPPGNYMMVGTVTVKCDQTTPHETYLLPQSDPEYNGTGMKVTAEASL